MIRLELDLIFYNIMQFCKDLLLFFTTTLYPRGEKHLDVAEIEPGHPKPMLCPFHHGLLNNKTLGCSMVSSRRGSISNFAAKVIVILQPSLDSVKGQTLHCYAASSLALALLVNGQNNEVLNAREMPISCSSQQRKKTQKNETRNRQCRLFFLNPTFGYFGKEGLGPFRMFEEAAFR